MIAFLIFIFIITTISLLCAYVQFMLKLTFSSCVITCLPPKAICPILLQLGSLRKITSLGLLLTNVFSLGPHLNTFKAGDTVFKIFPHIRRLVGLPSSLSFSYRQYAIFQIFIFYLILSFCFNINSLFLDRAMNRACICDFLVCATQDSSQFIGNSHWHRFEGIWTVLCQQVFPCPFCVPTLGNPITCISVCCCCNTGHYLEFTLLLLSLSFSLGTLNYYVFKFSELSPTVSSI